ncbi:8-oxo-dGTP diphosphatase [Saccharomycopsis crataegensis]|uniref:8-oxo-dGTP diphosphatase n=1 Tax=Saccharomycopsis crataegensis TaxID=43959 RepID=A0AAV5QH04_9ASCO|nr:8-oxo-dGTP diphosphatase [Saccharomycopsis crataegensis]
MSTEACFLPNVISYKPLYYHSNTKTTVWHKLPISRRSAVLVILFLGRCGELRVILTKRSRSLRNFSGHVSFPGGKADNGLESEWETSRREAFEEIGFPKSDEELSKLGLKLEKLNFLPCFVARTVLAVRPCVGILRTSSDELNILDKSLQFSLNPGESSSIFSVPLRDFFDQRKIKSVSKEANLKIELQEKSSEYLEKRAVNTSWAGIKWCLRSLIYPQSNHENEATWLADVDDLSSEDESSNAGAQNQQVRNVWGLTANILYELAQIAYKGQEYWDKKRNIGEEELLYSLSTSGGQLKDGKRSDFEVGIINGDKKTSFGDVLPKDEEKRLIEIYNNGSKI